MEASWDKSKASGQINPSELNYLLHAEVISLQSTLIFGCSTMSTQPIIIKRKRGGEAAGHHGGAWKVAYADFVTAMMAFFLLMWLLNATTEEQRKGIADYFDPAIPISPISGGGNDMLNGDSTYATDSMAYDNHGGEAESLNDEADLIERIEAALNEALDDQQASVTLSDEGIVVNLLETDGAPLFALGNAEPSDLLAEVMRDITPVLMSSGRPIKLVGHTDDLPFRNGAQYTNWELSADRANAARRLALQFGLQQEQISEVVGKADRQPLVDDRSSPENRRISVIMQNKPNFSGPLEAH
ncbi:flagellar motor protein MotB [Parvularcula sp. LCG005]|uniref:flagellar motor protein MotB n=1 Tax=Parvularcula sp. LCG005 TaxID=3078805 RepID=UPI002942BA86|nr:flagellar motor protein MotB [Parvularcula sp. LCG005]WOI52938.1 flagellar motor protein MotB [Parvularcula sp. LCG005]